MHARVSSESTTNLKQEEEEVKMAKTMMLIIITFLVSWMPLTIHFTAVSVSQNSRLLRDVNETFGFVMYNIALMATHLNMVTAKIY